MMEMYESGELKQVLGTQAEPNPRAHQAAFGRFLVRGKPRRLATTGLGWRNTGTISGLFPLRLVVLNDSVTPTHRSMQ